MKLTFYIGMVVLLVVVLTISYYTQLEGFDNIDACAGITDATPASKVPISCLQQLWIQNQCSLPTLPAIYLPEVQKGISDAITKGNLLTTDIDKSIGTFGIMKLYLANAISDQNPKNIKCLGPAVEKPAKPIPAKSSDLSKKSVRRRYCRMEYY
jgi:hypothetical protein